MDRNLTVMTIFAIVLYFIERFTNNEGDEALGLAILVTWFLIIILIILILLKILMIGARIVKNLK